MARGASGNPEGQGASASGRPPAEAGRRAPRRFRARRRAGAISSAAYSRRRRVGVLALGLVSGFFCLFAAIAPGMDHGRWTATSSLSSLLALLVVGAALAASWRPGAGFLLILAGVVEAVLLLAAMLSRTGYLLRDVLLSILPTGGLAILAGALAVDAGSREATPPAGTRGASGPGPGGER